LTSQILVLSLEPFVLASAAFAWERKASIVPEEDKSTCLIDAGYRSPEEFEQQGGARLNLEAQRWGSLRTRERQEGFYKTAGEGDSSDVRFPRSISCQEMPEHPRRFRPASTTLFCRLHDLHVMMLQQISRRVIYLRNGHLKIHLRLNQAQLS
jgi:hypothetical protein